MIQQTTQRLKPGPKGPHKDPALKKVAFATRLSPYIIDALRKQGNQAAFIESALIKALKL